MNYFYLNNLSSMEVHTTTSPWATKAKDYTAWNDKNAFIKWAGEHSTRHCFYSLYEGIDSRARLTPKENPPLFMYGFVVDYDSVISKDMKQTLQDRLPSEYMPNRICSTFSHGVRLIWDFSEKIPMNDLSLAKAFLSIAARKMKFHKLFPGFDKEAFLDVFKYYEMGRDWESLCSDTIPLGMLNNWLSLAGDKIVFTPSRLRIPIASIQEELHKRFPGRWKGQFEVGARGVRFWDSQADNQTSCIIREEGVQCFTGEDSFLNWEYIFGTSFVEKYKAKKIGDIITGTFYDNKQFWRKGLSNTWENINKEDYKLELKARYKLCTRVGKGENVSEVDNTLFKIMQINRVESAVSIPNTVSGLSVSEGKKYLNVSTIQCMPPAKISPSKWGDKFPWIANFLNGFFTTDTQKTFFLAWLKWYYENAYKLTPRRGHALFLAGPTGTGKTFLSTVIIAKMLGGSQDASSYFLGENGRFTDYIFESPLLTLDDTTPTSDEYAHKRYSALIKRLVANEYFVNEGKFAKSQQVRWAGRIVVTCNTDPESIRMLPHTEASIMDKISFFRAAYRPEFNFPDDPISVVKKEIPYLCKWLLNWKMPPELKGASRFGVKGYLEESLLKTSQFAVASYALYEVLLEFSLRRHQSTKETVWEGRTIALAGAVSELDDLEKISRAYVTNIKRFGRELSKLAAQDDNFITCSRSSSKGHVWTLTLSQELIDCYAL